MPALDPETRRETWRRYYSRVMATKDGREGRAARERQRRPSWLGRAVEELISDPDASVTITGRSVTVQAQWTGWAIKRFDRGSLAASMSEAIACRAHYRRAHPND